MRRMRPKEVYHPPERTAPPKMTTTTTSHLLHGGVEELEQDEVRGALGRISDEQLAHGLVAHAHPHAAEHARDSSRPRSAEGKRNCRFIPFHSISFHIKRRLQLTGGGREQRRSGRAARARARVHHSILSKATGPPWMNVLDTSHVTAAHNISSAGLNVHTSEVENMER